MAHIHEKIDFAADVFIVHDNKVLLRMHDKYHMWLAPGGHIELDEDPNQAALREVKEEVGLDVKLWDGNIGPIKSDDRVKVLIPPVAMNRHPTTGAHEHISLVYFATTDNDQIHVDHSLDDYSDEVRWFTREELDTTDMPENIRAYAQYALEKLAK